MSENCFITVNAEPLDAFSKYYYISSPDIPGICLVGKKPAEIFKNIPEIIEILFKDNYGLDVIATKFRRNDVCQITKVEKMEIARNSNL